jgi:hypothetical protein
MLRAVIPGNRGRRRPGCPGLQAGACDLFRVSPYKGGNPEQIKKFNWKPGRISRILFALRAARWVEFCISLFAAVYSYKSGIPVLLARKKPGLVLFRSCRLTIIGVEFDSEKASVHSPERSVVSRGAANGSRARGGRTTRPVPGAARRPGPAAGGVRAGRCRGPVPARGMDRHGAERVVRPAAALRGCHRR